MDSELIFETKLPGNLKEADFTKALKETYKFIKTKPQGSIHLSFVSAKDSELLNSRYSGIDNATDVLSFAFPKPAESQKKPFLFAEIVICTPIAKAQAKTYKVSLLDEATLLFVHGILHCNGLDHQTSTEQASFSSAQNDIMKSLNKKARVMQWSH